MIGRNCYFRQPYIRLLPTANVQYFQLIVRKLSIDEIFRSRDLGIIVSTLTSIRTETQAEPYTNGRLPSTQSMNFSYE